MSRIASTVLLAVVLLASWPARAMADVTAFLGFSPTTEARGARGFGIGLNLIIVGFEFEYSSTSEDLAAFAPGLRTATINGMLQTPTRTQLYLTAGGGFFRERLGQQTETHFGTNIGGGVKLPLAGPIRLRLDYRVFSLRGDPIDRTPQRFYAGLNVAF